MAGKRSQQFTVIVVGDHSQAVRKYRVAGRWLRYVVGVAGIFGLALTGLLIHYFSLLGQASENRQLREQYTMLRSEHLLQVEKINHIEATLERVERNDAQLRSALTPLRDPERNLPMGPMGSDRETSSIPGPIPAAQENPATLSGRLSSLEAEANRQERSLRELQEYFEDQKSLLASTPSLWPTRGWVTSDFGIRLDPYTAESKMHMGLDIATPRGQPIYAPSDGTVVFAGTEGGYGKVLVLDHGYGVQTRYGHLSEIYVHQGEQVKRGSRVAAVGNTGRSTGPHLHYEVRVNGVPENPRKFILE